MDFFHSSTKYLTFITVLLWGWNAVMLSARHVESGVTDGSLRVTSGGGCLHMFLAAVCVSIRSCLGFSADLIGVSLAVVSK